MTHFEVTIDGRPFMKGIASCPFGAWSGIASALAATVTEEAKDVTFLDPSAGRFVANVFNHDWSIPGEYSYTTFACKDVFGEFLPSMKVVARVEGEGYCEDPHSLVDHVSFPDAPKTAAV